jgi:hypothetical protein
MSTDSPDRIMQRLSAADPASTRDQAPPPLERVTAARRRRSSRNTARIGGAGTLLAVAATLALVLPGTEGRDVIAQAADRLSGPDVLHTVTITRRTGEAASKAESWRAPDGDQRHVVRAASGEIVAELALRDDESLSWDAKDDILYKTANTALEDDPLTLLSQARAGHAGFTQLEDATVRGIAVHVIALGPKVAGDDPVPERRYFIDKETFLPVRIEFGETVTDVLEAETIPLEDASRLLTMSPHPTATVRDFRGARASD